MMRGATRPRAWRERVSEAWEAYLLGMKRRTTSRGESPKDEQLSLDGALRKTPDIPDTSEFTSTTHREERQVSRS